MITPYVTTAEADAYMDLMLENEVWVATDPGKKLRALAEASQHIDTLAFISDKVDTNQEHEFPRVGLGTPIKIKYACVEIANALVKGANIDMEISTLAVSGESDSPAQTQYSRSHEDHMHIRNGIISFKAWEFIRPYLVDTRTIKINRS